MAETHHHLTPEEEEMAERERDLAEDAPWKKIQQNTFTRWANEHLKQCQSHIVDLGQDFSDGLKLIQLIQVLSGKKLPKYNKKPQFRSQKLENVSVALKFLERDEHIKIVNIDSTDIVDCKLKLILGLIWTLILHYSISLPMWEGEPEDQTTGGKGPTPKQRLLNWIKNKVPDMPIDNFTTDWNDGRAVGALVDAVAPGLCPDWQEWSPKTALQNAKEAMDLADNWLGVPQLIKPEEMVDPKVDEQSMMTYLSQYPNAKLKPGAPIRPKSSPSKVRAYGPGIEPTGVVVGAPANFTVETFSAGKGSVEVVVENPKGEREPVEIKFNNDRNLTYSVTYNPRLEGMHKVTVKFSGHEIPKSPFGVQVQGFAGDASKVTASGPGLEPEGVVVSRGTYFDIVTKGAGKGIPEVIILDPAGNRNTAPVKIKQTGADTWRCEYSASVVGLHSINIFFAGKQIPKSPFGVRVAPLCDARKVRVTGRGVQANGLRVRDTADFQVHTKGCGQGVLEVKIIGPGGVNEPITIRRIDEDTYEGVYLPKKEGRYIVMITYGGHEVPRSPFEVNVKPFKTSKIRAFGPGLEGGVVDEPALFTVETNGEEGTLGFSIEGPSKCKIDCHDNEDGTADVRYFPTAPGEYAVHVTCDKEDIPKSPFMAKIVPKTDFYPDKVVCAGPGIEPNGVVAGRPTEFTVDTRSAGKAPLDVTVMDEEYNPIEVAVKENPDGTKKCFYTPKKGNKHTVQVNFGGVATKKSPYRVFVEEPVLPGKVQVFGPGVEPGVKSQTPTYFNVDCRDAGPGNLQVSLVNDIGMDIPFRINDNQNGTFSVDYTAPLPGLHTLTILYGGQVIPQCPIHIPVKPHVDTSMIKVEGLEKGVFVDCTTDATVDARAVEKDSSAQVKCNVVSPSGKILPSKVKPVGDGTYNIQYTPVEEGPHSAEILYDGVPVPKSPFIVNAKKGAMPNRVKVSGPGIEKGIVDQPNTFTVDTRGAGQGTLGFAVEGPAEAKITCVDNKDGTCKVDYVTKQPGEYDISVKYADTHVPGSPFKVPVDYPVDANKVVLTGKGIEPKFCRANVPSQFHVDASKTGKAPMAVEVKADKAPIPRRPEVVDNKDGTYDVTYMPPPEGAPCQVRVTYDGKDVPKSPVSMKVLPTCEPQNVKVTAPPNAGKGLPASLPTEVAIDATDAGYGDLHVNILGPDNTPRPVRVLDKGDGTFRAQFTPDDVGDYKVNVKYGGKDVPNTPLKLKAVPTGKAEECKITEGKQDMVTIGEEYCITVNTKNAGTGAVTCRIRSTTGSDLDVDIEENTDGTFSIFYSVKEVGDYTISVKFGGKDVPGGTYKLHATKDESYRRISTTKQEAYEEAYSRTTTTRTERHTTTTTTSEYRAVELPAIPLPSTGGSVVAEVKMPSGKRDKPTIIDNHDGTVSVRYEPREEGLHELIVKYNGEHVQGSPFKFHVDTISSGYVTAHGPGLTHGICGEPCNFTVTTKGAGAGGLSVAVEGPSKADITCHDNKDGTIGISYLPTAPGEYKVSCKFADKHIKGSPFTVKVTGEGRKRNQISVGSQSEVSLPGKVSETDIKSLNASIQAPSGLEEPCFLKRLPSGNPGISFTPREVGKHKVSVKKMGTHIHGSPFDINVGEMEVGDSKKVTVSGKALKEGKTHVDNEVIIDTKHAGYGGLSLSIEGPSKADIKCKDRDDGKLAVTYRPTEPGYYIMNLKFADHHVQGSPFTIKVTGEGSNQQRQHIRRDQEAVPITEVGNQCRLTFKIPGISPFELSALVQSPSGVSEDAEIQEIDEGFYAVNFVPKELGIHTVSVKFRDLHIPGSPFQFTVGPLRDAGAHRVHAGGPGLERGEVRGACEFNVWTREAGAGSLAISVEGPSKAEIDFKDRKDGSCYVSYAVTEPGEYRVGIKFNDQHIPDSPFKVYVTPQLGDAKKVELGQLPEHIAHVDKPIAFVIQKNGAKGQLDCKAVSPSGIEDDCFISPIDDEAYSCRFLPHEKGIHYLHVKLNGVHVPQSPIKLMIGQDVADPAAVIAEGKGLGTVVTGQKTDFIVNTCSAGAGTLAVTIDGPSKVAMDCTEIQEGYKISDTGDRLPLEEILLHMLTLAPPAPEPVDIEATNTTEPVPRVKHASGSSSSSDASGSEAGLLTLPDWPPQEVRYTPLAPGIYYVSVKYNGYHIAGSPFKVKCTGEKIADLTQGETSSVVVETIAKHSAKDEERSLLPKFKSDVSKVSCRGMGLKKAFVNKQNTFNVNAETAGQNILYVGVIGPKEPSNEVFVKHTGKNNYNVNYVVHERGDHVLIVKWGDDHVPGSPFKVEVP